MKPLHVGLLVLGAALAGGLAVKMTQPPPIPVTSTARPARTVYVPPAPQPPVQTVVPPELVPARKPSPISAPEASSPAPRAIFTQPVRRQVTAPRTEAPPPHPAVVPPPVAPRKRQEIAQAKPLDVPPLPPDPAPAQPLAPVNAAPLPKVIEPPAASDPEPPPMLHQVTLQPGLTIMVRIDEPLSTDRSVPGNTFNGSLVEPVVVDGVVIAERGARVTGRVLDSQKAGRVSGVSSLELGLSSLMTADGQRISIATDPWTKRGDTSRGADAAKIGGGAALGAAIGAIAGGGTGAAIGAGIGGAGGAGAVMATRGKPVEIPSETVVVFRISYAVTITERRI